MDALLLFLCLMMMAVFLDYQCVDANEEQGSRLRGLWKLSVKDSKWKTKAGLSPPHPIRGPVEQQLLYCQVGIGYHLQILSNGTIGGVHEPNEHSFLKLFAMRRGGVVGIRGIKSGLYLCMSREGVAHGAASTWPCPIKERPRGGLAWGDTRPAHTSSRAELRKQALCNPVTVYL
ncbi:fibroblast growth factor 4A isoform X3 [Esox lucius]|uniref:fibroblast growth factor 4A isoform X3 n=1 Tax=Esox lucius TaxID=8010 RepID=UPI0009734B83|nr:fibroblast growth factor 4A isoform X3 [Esox lucius]